MITRIMMTIISLSIFLRQTPKNYFFPEGMSKLGAAGEMHFDLGNFAQERISQFTDVDGNACTFQEYLRSRGLFASRCFVYLMSTATEEEREKASSCPSTQEGSDLLNLPLHLDAAAQNTASDVFMGIGKSELSEGFENLMKTSTPKSPFDVRESPKPVYALKDMKGNISPEDAISGNTLFIRYETLTESSYSEVVLKSMSFSISQCYDSVSLNNPLIREIELEAFDPLEHGFTIEEISKGGKSFVDRCYNSSSDDECGYIFPQATAQPSSLILHPPSEIWGYDRNELIMGVVASCHNAADAWYVWHRDGIKIKEGKTCCCVQIKAPGSYTVEVHSGEEKATSDPVMVCVISEFESPTSPVPSTSVTDSHCLLPVVEKEEITFSQKDEIGRGSFGVVYKGVWAGTNVAVKHVKIRHAKRIQSVVEREVRLHSMARHPNIVQIMAISFLKNSIYIVSELIGGHNLEELLFSDDGESSTTFNLQSYDKLDIRKQICQAVAYLHNLKPLVVHRDIKPANVLVAQTTHVTKLCDMGLSKLKSAQSLSQTTSTAIPGTPSYMAPECLLHNKKATVHSDIWALACTLIELFTEKDCWQQLMNEDEMGQDGGDLNNDCNPLIAIMKRKETPGSLESIPSTVGASFQQILPECCQYDLSRRPRAIDLVNAFH